MKMVRYRSPAARLAHRRLPLPGEAQIVARQHPRRDADPEADPTELAPTAAAVRADAFAEEAAPGALAAVNQPAAGAGHPPAAMTRGAKPRPGDPRLAAAGAGRAGLAARHFHRPATAEGRLFQADFEVQANVRRLPAGRRRLGDVVRHFCPFRSADRDKLVIGCPDLPETLGCRRVAVAVRMPAHDQPAIGALQVGGAGIRREAEN